MPITWYDDLDGLVRAVGSAPPEGVIQQVTDEVATILLKHIKSDIYDAYTPKEGAWVNGTTYQRRYGLLDEGNIVSVIEPDGTLVVTSNAVAGQSVIKGYEFSNEDSGFLQLLESGHMGIWKSGFARPAVANAQAEVDSSAKIKSLTGN